MTELLRFSFGENIFKKKKCFFLSNKHVYLAKLSALIVFVKGRLKRPPPIPKRDKIVMGIDHGLDRISVQ